MFWYTVIIVTIVFFLYFLWNNQEKEKPIPCEPSWQMSGPIQWCVPQYEQCKKDKRFQEDEGTKQCQHMFYKCMGIDAPERISSPWCDIQMSSCKETCKHNMPSDCMDGCEKEYNVCRGVWG